MPKKPKKMLMRRTTIWLEPEVAKAADKHAAKRGVSRAFLIRQVLRRELGMPVAPVEQGGNDADVFE